MGDETIFAVATGRVRAGIAIIRVSGSRTRAAVQALTGRVCPKPRIATRRHFQNAAGEMLDDGLVIWFPQPASFTGEDVAEFHLHGGRSVVNGVLSALAVVPGLRSAEPGEFSRRAVLNGKIDLTEAEGIADLIAAETAMQRRQALRQVAGDLSQKYDAWRDCLLQMTARLEVAIDFSDEDIPEGLEEEVLAAGDALAREIEYHLDSAERGKRLRDGIDIVVLGAPNAGKSALVNALAHREVAIVSPRPGTTRDILEVPLDMGGFPVLLCDTAGLRETSDEIEAEGARRAEQRGQIADVRIRVIDGQLFVASKEAKWPVPGPGEIVVISKADLWECSPRPDHGSVIAVSSHSGKGLAALRHKIETELDQRFGTGLGIAPTRQRHQEGLRACVAALRRMHDQSAIELRAEELRGAAFALGRITGRVDIEEVLGAIFAEFCLGK